MSLPHFQHPPKKDEPAIAHTHYFDAANGDVAALHARIERGFADYSLGQSPFSPTSNRFETTVRLFSRGAGLAGLTAGLLLVAYSIF